jgi:hypothetical protein
MVLFVALTMIWLLWTYNQSSDYVYVKMPIQKLISTVLIFFAFDMCVDIIELNKLAFADTAPVFLILHLIVKTLKEFALGIMHMAIATGGVKRPWNYAYDIKWTLTVPLE